jgi:alkaline phosphatase D
MFSRRRFLRYSAAAAGSLWMSTAVSGCKGLPRRSSLSAARFEHGVASGDPLADAVVLWTRAVPQAGDAAGVKLGWELAADPGFERILRGGEVSTDRARDYTVKIDVRELDAGRDYYYRFYTATSESPVGRARTLPSGRVEQLRMAVFSCSNYPAGYFHPYAEASRLENLDVWLHLGDYIYEYGSGGYATERAAELGRDFAADNSGELLTLDDYRRRYALYRSDPDLQAMHAAAPCIAVWDDHEIANDTWREGAQNHSPEEGDFALRRDAAVQAYFEWLPIRPLVPDASGAIYRGFDFGDLVSLHMLDTRLIGRDRQLEYAEFIDPDSGAMDVTTLGRELRDPGRSLLGDAQRDWLRQRFASSPGRWQVLGQQVLMARMVLPGEMLRSLFAGGGYERSEALIRELAELKAAAAAGHTLAEGDLHRLRTALPYNLDAWDGYPAEREQVYAAARDAGRSLVVLAGDTHNAWYSRLRAADGALVGVELGTSSVSSPGMESYLRLDAAQASALARSMPLLIDELDWCELHSRGFLEVRFTPEEAHATWHFVDGVQQRDYRVSRHEQRISA